VIALATIAFNQPRLISEQIRLLQKNLQDPYRLTVFDNSSKLMAADEIERVCAAGGAEYRRLSTRMHHDGLNQAARELLSEDDPYLGFLDHDIFPIRETTLIDKISEMGFYGVGQRHPATGHLYIWPGFAFFSSKWLNGRPLDFSGLRDGNRRNDGDTGSGLWPLFENEDWEKLFRAPHFHRPIRKPDEYGLQSWGYEEIGDWLHFTNGSRWMNVPDFKQRERLLFDLLK
jgi:hypothetical protein